MIEPFTIYYLSNGRIRMTGMAESPTIAGLIDPSEDPNDFGMLDEASDNRTQWVDIDEDPDELDDATGLYAASLSHLTADVDEYMTLSVVAAGTLTITNTSGEADGAYAVGDHEIAIDNDGGYTFMFVPDRADHLDFVQFVEII
jgi:hypothetical protein